MILRKDGASGMEESNHMETQGRGQESEFRFMLQWNCRSFLLLPNLHLLSIKQTASFNHSFTEVSRHNRSSGTAILVASSCHATHTNTCSLRWW